MRRLIVAAFLATLSVPAVAETSFGSLKEAYTAYKEAVAEGRKRDARIAASAAYTMAREKLGTNHKYTAAFALHYGRLLEGDEAKQQLREALILHENVYGQDGYELLDPLMELAKVETGYQEFRTAKRLYDRALSLVEANDGPESMTAGLINLEIGQVATFRGAGHRYIAYLKRAKKIFQSLDEPDAAYGLAQAEFWLGKYWLANNEEKKATDALVASLETFEANAPDSPTTLANHAFLIEAYEKRGLRDAATKHCRAIGAAKPVNPTQDYKPVYQVRPIYPRIAQVGGKEGYVVVSVTVDPDGFVQEPEVLETKGSGLFEGAALEAVKQFRYIPRYEDGQPVATSDVKYRFSFTLAN